MLDVSCQNNSSSKWKSFCGKTYLTCRHSWKVFFSPLETSRKLIIYLFKNSISVERWGFILNKNPSIEYKAVRSSGKEFFSCTISPCWFFIYFPLHNCTSMHANLIFWALVLGNHFLPRQDNISEQSLCESKKARERECVVTKVWLWMSRQCAGMPLCQLEFESSCEWDYVVISTKWRAFACGIKTSGFRQSLDQEAPDCCDPLPDDILASSLSGWCCSSQLQALWQRPQLMHMLRLHPVCKPCHTVGHVSNHRGASCWLQHTVVLSSPGFPNHKSPLRASSQPECTSLPHTGPRP